MAPQILTLRAIPLTPIHVGDGTELTPDQYKIGNRELLLFNPARTLAGLPEEQRKRYLQALDHGQLEESHQIIREAVRDEQVTGRIAVSDSSAEALRRNANRSGRIHPFVRSGGKPFIPGSSIKGALRTALINRFADAGVKSRVEEVRDVRSKHNALVKSALNLASDDTSDDPLRFLSVADTAIPDDATRIDRAYVIKRDRDGTLKPNDMQMHYERLLGASDGPLPRDHWLNVTVQFDEEAMRDSRRRSCPPGRVFGLKDLHDAVCEFHWGRWQSERERFFSGEARTCAAMDRLLNNVKKEGKALADIGPTAIPNYWLLRIGRFGHFESKSVDGLRQGRRPQDKDHPQLAPGSEGISRTVVRVGSGGREAFIPFGWLLLFHEAAR